MLDDKRINNIIVSEIIGIAWVLSPGTTLINFFLLLLGKHALN